MPPVLHGLAFACRLTRRGAYGMAACLLAVACAPTLNWREIRVSPTAVAWLPCKPETLERRVPLGGQPVAATMWVCDAGEATWSVTVFEVAGAPQQAAALREARHLLAMNLAGREVASRAWQGGGFAASDEMRRMTWAGQRPGGLSVTAHAAFVADGGQVLQVVALVPSGRAVSDAVLDEFFAGLRRAPAGAS